MYTGTRPWVTPAIRAGKGWRGRRELAPRCSATQLDACAVRSYRQGEGVGEGGGGGVFFSAEEEDEEEEEAPQDTGVGP